MDRDLPPVDMDAVAAHLDRGWDLLRKNDLRGAEISAERALDLDPDCPEAFTLLGLVAAGAGDEDEAADRYRKALDIDPEYVSPMLYLAEILMADAEERKEAQKLVDEALDLADDEEDVLDALLLKAEIHLDAGELTEARATLDDIPPVPLPEPVYHVRVGGLRLELGDLDLAEEELDKAVAADPKNGDAHHGLGLIHEEREDPRAMIQEWLVTREIDLEEPPPAWSLSQEEFEGVAEAALAELPARIRLLLENVPVLVTDYPALEIVAEGNDPRMLGFFSGVPYPDKSHVGGGPPELDCVFLYKQNIERMCRDGEEAKQEIRTTLLHETGHFFGLSEEELEAMGLG